MNKNKSTSRSNLSLNPLMDTKKMPGSGHHFVNGHILLGYSLSTWTKKYIHVVSSIANKRTAFIIE